MILLFTNVHVIGYIFLSDDKNNMRGRSGNFLYFIMKLHTKAV